MRLNKQIALCLSVIIFCVFAMNSNAFASGVGGNSIRIAIVSEKFSGSNHKDAHDLARFLATGKMLGLEREGDCEGKRVSYQFKHKINTAYVPNAEFEIKLFPTIAHVLRKPEYTGVDLYDGILSNKDIIIVLIDLSKEESEWKQDMKTYATYISKSTTNPHIMFVPSQDGMDGQFLNRVIQYVSPSLEIQMQSVRGNTDQFLCFVGRHSNILTKVVEQVAENRNIKGVSKKTLWCIGLGTGVVTVVGILWYLHSGS